MVTTERPTQFKVIGSSPARQDAVDKVTGKAVYGTDVRVANTLSVAVVRSPHAHARIRNVDVSAALALPGVRAVVTHQDFPPLPAERPAMSGVYGVGFLSLRDARVRVLAAEKALFAGHAIAAVAADSRHVADEAAAKITVEYEVLPAVMNVEQAMRPHAPPVIEKLELVRAGMQQIGPNTLHTRATVGDVAKAFGEADVVVEREFNTKTVHHGFIEPISTTVVPDHDGGFTVWSTCQGAFFFRDQICKILELPETKVKVVPTEVGGAFGGKEVAFVEPIAVMLARKSGQPVRMTMTRAEIFQGSGPACGTQIKIKFGAMRDGRLVAAQAHLAYEAGAFPGAPLANAITWVFTRYKIPNQLIDAYDVLVNKPKTQSYRAPGATQCHFASETLVDELAEKLDIDPLEFRIRNAAAEGDRNIHGVPLPANGVKAVLEAVRRHPHYTAPLSGPNRGRGFALGLWAGHGQTSTASMAVNADGSVNLVTGSPDMSGTRVGLAMQAAEELGLPVAAIKSTTGDTESIGLTMPSWGSRVTFATGWATVEAARELNRRMAARAAQIWGCPIEDVLVESGTFQQKGKPEACLTFAQLAAKLASTGGAVIASASIDPSRGAGPGAGAHIVDVEVDPQTGKVDILRCTVVQDVGRAVHRDLVIGQMQGGTVQGIGWGLSEEYSYNADGRMLNPTLLDYRLPTTLDIPDIDTVIVEVPNPGHPYGVRGAGESSIVTPPAAIANAIQRAVGVRLTELPMAPGTVLKALQQKGA